MVGIVGETKKRTHMPKTVRKPTDWDALLPAKKLLFSIKELGDLNIIARTTAHRLIDNGEIEAIRVGEAGKKFIPRPAIVKYLQDRTQPQIVA